MNLIKSLGILFLPWVLWAQESTSKNEELTEASNKATEVSALKNEEATEVFEAEVKLSENLKTNNPFIPYKNSGNSANFEATDSSDFEFCSFAEYPTHQEFSLKEKVSGKSFWLSSDGKDKGLDFGIKYWNFYPKDHVLVIQDVASGTLINMVQKKPEMVKAKTSTGLSSDSNEDFLKLLEDFDDENNEDGGK